MSSTRIHHSPDLTLRPRANEAPAKAKTAPGEPDPIPYDVWMQFHAVIVQALIPYKEPLQKVTQAVNELGKRLGIVI